MTQFDSPATLD